MSHCLITSGEFVFVIDTLYRRVYKTRFNNQEECWLTLEEAEAELAVRLMKQ